MNESLFVMDWVGLCSVLRPRQHSIGYMGDGFYRSKDPTNSTCRPIKVLKEKLYNGKSNNVNNKIHICIDNDKGIHTYTSQQVP